MKSEIDYIIRFIGNPIENLNYSIDCYIAKNSN